MKKGKEIEQYVGKDGDMYVTLFSENGVGSEHRVCDLVWSAFKGDIPDGYHVAHKDGNKSNNRLDNLKLVKYGSNLS